MHDSPDNKTEEVYSIQSNPDIATAQINDFSSPKPINDIEVKRRSLKIQKTLEDKMSSLVKSI